MFEFPSTSAAQAAFEELKSNFSSCTSGTHYAAGSSRTRLVVSRIRMSPIPRPFRAGAKRARPVVAVLEP
jgi:hypothetical protein